MKNMNPNLPRPPATCGGNEPESASGVVRPRAGETVERAWGIYTVLARGDGFQVKRLVVRPGAATSLQLHLYRNEHWMVISGRAHVTLGQTEHVLEPNGSVSVPRKQRHRLANPGTEELVVIEVQSGDYLEEDDIVRFSFPSCAIGGDAPALASMCNPLAE